MRDVLFAKRASADETVYDFFSRRMSQEVITYANIGCKIINLVVWYMYMYMYIYPARMRKGLK
jgi:hypothetical protein